LTFSLFNFRLSWYTFIGFLYFNVSCNFWRSAKCERIYLNEYQSIGELITDVDDYIEFYNHRKFHETLKYKKPMNVYRESIKLNKEKVKDT
jgi:hypothetical protein